MSGRQTHINLQGTEDPNGCLIQGNINVMEHTMKFNKLSPFAPNQVATEEMRMDHFE